MTKQLSSASSKLHPHPLTDIGSGDYIYTKERGKKAKVTTYRHNNKNKKKQYIHTHTHTHTHIYTHISRSLFYRPKRNTIYISTIHLVYLVLYWCTFYYDKLELFVAQYYLHLLFVLYTLLHLQLQLSHSILHLQLLLLSCNIITRFCNSYL